MHRGINMLRKQGLLPAGFQVFAEEIYVRALMQKAYSDIEMALMREGTMVSKNLKDYRLLEQGRSLKDHPTPSLLEERIKHASKQAHRDNACTSCLNRTGNGHYARFLSRSASIHRVHRTKPGSQWARTNDCNDLGRAAHAPACLGRFQRSNT